MPCCGLHEHQVKIPFRHTAAGSVVFWGFFAIGLVAGLALCWLPVGRNLLRAQREFVRALWREAMRGDQSLPSRLSCRISGTLLPHSPRLAAWVFRHPEVPLLYLPVAGLVAIAGCGLLLVRMLR